MTETTKAERFLALHHGDSPLLLANVWDAGSARLLESLGYAALATTSSGFAAALGRLDYGVTREEALGHGAVVAGAVDLPVSADLENCFAEDAAGVAETVRLAIEAGLAGGSIEDFTRRPDDPIYPIDEAVERVAAASEAAHSGNEGLRYVLTARAENYLHGLNDLADTIARLQRYQEAGADVLYAPAVSVPDDVRELVRSVDRPVNVLALPGGPTVAELAELGVARVSVGGAFAYAAYGALVAAAKELQDQGTYDFWTTAGVGAQAAQAAFKP